MVIFNFYFNSIKPEKAGATGHIFDAQFILIMWCDPGKFGKLPHSNFLQKHFITLLVEYYKKRNSYYIIFCVTSSKGKLREECWVVL